MDFRHRHKDKKRCLSTSSCFVLRKEGDWLLHSLWSLRLTPFPSARRRGSCKITQQELLRSNFLFLTLRRKLIFVIGIKTKKDVFRHLLVSFCGRRGIRTPGTLIEYVSLANWWFQPLAHPSKPYVAFGKAMQKYVKKIRVPNIHP